MMRALLATCVLVLACQPKQPLQPSFFTQKQGSGLTCKETIECYAQCKPLVEECMLRCDQRAQPPAIEPARAVSACSLQNGCTDAACEQERCAPQLDVCTKPKLVPPPNAMQPQPYPMQSRPIGPPPPPPPPPPPASGDPRPPGPVE